LSSIPTPTPNSMFLFVGLILDRIEGFSQMPTFCLSRTKVFCYLRHFFLFFEWECELRPRICFSSILILIVREWVQSSEIAEAC
jgi:hypothetical protein